MQRLRSDCAMACATVLLEAVAPALVRPEERREAFRCSYTAVAVTLESYYERKTRERSRLAEPSTN